MDCNYDKIVELLDPDSGLLQQLLTARCISEEQKLQIESESTSRERSSQIIDCLRQKDEFYLVSLLDCLKCTKQPRLALAVMQSAGKLLHCS